MKKTFGETEETKRQIDRQRGGPGEEDWVQPEPRGGRKVHLQLGNGASVQSLVQDKKETSGVKILLQLPPRNE